MISFHSFASLAIPHPLPLYLRSWERPGKHLDFARFIDQDGDIQQNWVVKFARNVIQKAEDIGCSGLVLENAALHCCLLDR